MPLVGKPRSFHKRFLFTIEIPGVGWAGFQKCGEIKSSTAVVTQWEGAGQLSWKVSYDSPGRVKVADVTLERGATSDLALWRWFQLVANPARAVKDDEYKRTINVTQRDRDGKALRHWVLANAWPTEFSAGDRDNTSDANAIEAVTLTYDYPEPSDDK